MFNETDIYRIFVFSEAHDLPVQPALEQGLRALQRCFQDQYFVEAQTLGHFLLYHLTPNQLDAAERAAACSDLNSIEGARNSGNTDRGKIDPSSSPASSSLANERFCTNKSRATVTTARRAGILNGHGSEQRRRSTRRGLSISSTAVNPSSTEESQSHCAYDIEDCSSSSSMEESTRKDDDEEDDDEDEDDAEEDGGHSCVDDVGEHDGGEDDDEDEPDGGQSAGGSRSRNRDARHHDGSSGGNSGGSHGNSNPFRGEQSSNGANSGGASRIQSSSLTQRSAPSPVLRTRRALVARFCQSIVLDDSHTRVFNSTSSPISPLPPQAPQHSGLGSLRNQNPATTTAGTTVTTNPIPGFRSQSATAPVAMSRTGSGNSSNNICLSDPDGTSNNPHNMDPAFHGLVSLSYPHHTEFLAAMNDALKAYAGTLLLSDDEQLASCSLSSPIGRTNHGGRGEGGSGAAGPSLPPSPGSGTCAP